MLGLFDNASVSVRYAQHSKPALSLHNPSFFFGKSRFDLESRLVSVQDRGLFS